MRCITLIQLWCTLSRVLKSIICREGSSGNFYLQHSWSILAVAELWLWWQWYRRDGDLRNLHEWSWHMETDHPISWMLLFRWRCKLVLCFCYFTPNTKLLKIPAYKTEKQATLSLNHCTNDVHNITGDWRLEVCAGRCLGGHCDAVWRMVTGTLRTRQRNQAEAATLQTSAHCLASL